jgi:hypothetical protein
MRSRQFERYIEYSGPDPEKPPGRQVRMFVWRIPALTG